MIQLCSQFFQFVSLYLLIVPLILFKLHFLCFLLFLKGGLTITEYEGSPRRYGPRLEKNSPPRRHQYDDDIGDSGPEGGADTYSPRIRNNKESLPPAENIQSHVATKEDVLLQLGNNNNNNNNSSWSPPLSSLRPPNGSVLPPSPSADIRLPSPPQPGKSSNHSMMTSEVGPGHQHHHRPPPPGSLGGEGEGVKSTTSQLIAAGETEPSVAGPPVLSPSLQVKTKGQWTREFDVKNTGVCM
jgi:hypothetical protein